MIRDRLGRIVEDVESIRAAQDGARPGALDRQQDPEPRVRRAQGGGRAPPRQGGRDRGARRAHAARSWRSPTCRRTTRTTARGSPARSCATACITDSFEPGSTLKPFTVALALETGKVNAATRGADRARQAHARATTPSATRIPRGSHERRAGARAAPPTSARRRSRSRCRAKRCGTSSGASASAPRPSSAFPATPPAGCAQPEDLAADRAGHHGLRPRHLGQPGAARARLHRVRARRGIGAADAGQTRRGGERARRCCRAETARAVRAMLELAVQPGGTAPRARVMGWRVAGKTGTAHKQENGGYAARQVPLLVRRLRAGVSAPRLVIAVMIDEPSAGQHYGGAVAAPGVRAGDAGRAAPARRAARRAARRRAAGRGRGSEGEHVIDGCFSRSSRARAR